MCPRVSRPFRVRRVAVTGKVAVLLCCAPCCTLVIVVVNDDIYHHSSSMDTSNESSDSTWLQQYDTFRSSGQLTMSCSGTHRDTAVFDPTQVLDTGLKSARFYHWQAASAERQHAAQLAQLLYTPLTCCQYAADFFGVLGGGRIRK